MTEILCRIYLFAVKTSLNPGLKTALKPGENRVKPGGSETPLYPLRFPVRQCSGLTTNEPQPRKSSFPGRLRSADMFIVTEPSHCHKAPQS